MGWGDMPHLDIRALRGSETSAGNGGLSILRMSSGPSYEEKYLRILGSHMV